MKTDRNRHSKTRFFAIPTFVLLLALVVCLLPIVTTYGKYSQDIPVDSEWNFLLYHRESDPENPDRPGIEESAPTDVYEVQPSDTLASIAKEFHISVESLAACNSLSPSAPLSPGTNLKLPFPRSF